MICVISLFSCFTRAYFPSLPGGRSVIRWIWGWIWIDGNCKLYMCLKRNLHALSMNVLGFLSTEILTMDGKMISITWEFPVIDAPKQRGWNGSQNYRQCINSHNSSGPVWSRRIRGRPLVETLLRMSRRVLLTHQWLVCGPLCPTRRPICLRSRL